MNQVSDRLASLSPSETLAMSQKSNELKAQGIDIINLSVGEPDFFTPEHIKAAAKKAIDDNFSFYSPVPGYMDLRKAICSKLKNENNLDFTPEQIVVSNGAKQSICNAILCIVNPGDEVIIPAPCWVSYVEMVKLAEGKSVVIPSGIENDFKITPAQLEAAITPKTKAIILCSPSNPTGSVYSHDELKALADVLAKYPQVIILADEIYEHINYIGGHQSIAQFENVRERVAIINGVSKAYAMTGWRIGYTAAPAPVTKLISNYLSHSTAAPSTISQAAAAEAFRGSQESVKRMHAAFEARRNYMVERMNAIDSISCLKPQGAFYVMMNLDGVMGRTIRGHAIGSSADFASAFVQEEMVATVPGSAFGADRYVRWSYATDMDTIRKGMDRLETFIKDLK